MAYMYKQAFSLHNHPYAALFDRTVLLAEPHAEAAAMYKQQLDRVRIETTILDNIALMEQEIASLNPDVVVVNPTYDFRKGLLYVQEVKESFPHLPLLSISKTVSERELDELMSAGISMHLNRQLTQPKDLLVAIEQVIKN